MVEYVTNNAIDKVLVTELSRLGRNTLGVLEVIELLNSKKVSIYIQNYAIETLTPEGAINPMSQFLITNLSRSSKNGAKKLSMNE